MKLIITLISLVIFNISLNAQELYRIYLRDKGNQVLEYNNDLYNDILNKLDKKAVERRKINLKTDNIIFEKDIPIYEKYLDSLVNNGVSIRSKLKWYNYIIAEIDSNRIEEIGNYNFVVLIQPIVEHYNNTINTLEFSNCDLFEYGNSFNHLDMLNIPNLHRYGFTGKGVRIGFLDNGFDLRTHIAIKNANVIKSYDFIFRDSIVHNEEGDINSQDDHGSVVFSTVAAFDNGNYIGIAPNAEFYLAKTEDNRSETYLELDNFAEAIIWMENNGVDVINASLGYKGLDSNSLNYENLDGSYTIASRSINDASTMGMICVIASGNNGDIPMSLISPADADSSVAVGALNVDGVTLTSFSSNGPNAKGLLKPNLVAQGGSIYSISPNSEDKYNPTAGTSLASPLIAGSFGLLKSAFRYTDSYTLKSNMFQSADKYDNPDNRFGYGLPDVFQAVKVSGVAISPENQLDNGDFKRLVFYIFPDNQILNAEIVVNYSEFKSKTYPLVKRRFDNQYYIDIPKQEFETDSAVARIKVKSYLRDYYYPNMTDYFSISLENDLVQCGVNKNEIIPEVVYSPISGFDIYPTIIQNYEKVNLALSLVDNYTIEINITDIQGQNIYEESLNYGPGVLNRQIELNNVISGAYFISVIYDNKRVSKKVIILN
ncbi:MAG: S8 family serine peptidase [Candidatus Kapaibacterium sp.]